jgi:hypothetical protein
MHIHSTTLDSNKDLHELVLQSMDQILGTSYEIITDKLPFDGNHILALDEERKPVVITYDNDDSGKALLSGIAVLEKLMSSRELLYRLYPRLAEITSSDDPMLSIEDILLIILAPQAIPGAHYLTRLLPNVSVYTHHTLKINDDVGLLIEPTTPKIDDKFSIDLAANLQPPEFRTGRFNLDEEEELFFQQI